MTEHVKTEVADGVMTLTLQRPEKKNALTGAMYAPNKDPNDQKWADDEGIKGYRAFFERYLAGSDSTNTSYLTGYQQGMVLEQILKQCGDDLSRDNIIKQAKSLKNLVLSTAPPGVRVNTSESNNMIWTQLQLQRWTGTRWEQFGEILDASSE
jgi:branched-chain amino acid transport system substrate-binding protein